MITAAALPQPPARARSAPPHFITLYVASVMGAWLLFFPATLVVLALRIEHLVPVMDRRAGTLGIIVGSGALLAMIINPLAGRLSDQTRSRFGRRRPWMLAGLALALLGLLLAGSGHRVQDVWAGWLLASAGLNGLLAAQTAVLPDRVPPEQRGLLSGLLGITQPAALILGTFLVQLAAPDHLHMLILPALVGAVLVVTFLLLPDPPAATCTHVDTGSGVTQKGSASGLQRLSLFCPGFTCPAFVWAWTSRLLVLLTFALLTTFQTFYLTRHLGTPAVLVPHRVFIGTALLTILAILASVVTGLLSDRFRHRRTLVMVAAAMVAVSMLGYAAASTFTEALWATGLCGLGFGAYTAAELSLVLDVLPNTDASAQNLGVMNGAGSLANTLAPLLAPLLLAVAGGRFSHLYLAAAGAALLGLLSLLPVRPTAPASGNI